MIRLHRFIQRCYLSGGARPQRLRQPPRNHQLQHQNQHQPVDAHPSRQPRTALLYLAASYLAVVNVASFGLFWYDKEKAKRREWRIPERTLKMSALLGGWAGGMLAMNTFKHKTVKQDFRIPYFVCTGLNMAMLIYCLYVYLQATLQGLQLDYIFYDLHVMSSTNA
ncbi:hypothetical protein SeMB42_g05786 [Synchytrium endobioticum]|uniref:DUF1294 domain-containing protein n=1 Tax=Synchytrium endobioticum TaxID=286115 RepID=A0A507CPD6_9FUNG|nr:hypothetical protein SeMB42_g05786 [Synchytrium endobioticum]TPX42847.1 hypothetical protein SeLEV6574_g05376 [Synchytrium endobioticum]